MSAVGATVTVAVSESSLGSGSIEVLLNVGVRERGVPPIVPGAMATTSVNVAVGPTNTADVHVIAPVAPTAGVVQLHPPGTDSDWNVVPAGIAVTISAP